MPIFSTLRIKLSIPLSDPWVTSLTTRIPSDHLFVTRCIISSEVLFLVIHYFYWIVILLQIKILDWQHGVVVRSYHSCSFRVEHQNAHQTPWWGGDRRQVDRGHHLVEERSYKHYYPRLINYQGLLIKQNQSGENFSRRNTATCPLIAFADAEGTCWCRSISPRKPSRCTPPPVDRPRKAAVSFSIFSFTRRIRSRLPDTCSNSRRRFTSVA